MARAGRIRAGQPARLALLRGIQDMTSLLRPTLGPLSRTVIVDQLVGSRPPEVLDNGALIARRTLQLRDPFEDMGGMLIRHLAWRVYDQVGDGSATAAVLAEALFRVGLRYVAAGASPIGVRRGMQCGLDVVLAALQRQARPIDGPEEISLAVAGVLRDPDLARLVGRVVDAVGPDGAIAVEDSEANDTSHEYLDGVRWNEGNVSPFLVEGTERLLEPRILVTDLPLERPEDLVATLEACVAHGERRLFIIAPEIRDTVVGMLVANRERGVIDGVVAVKAPLFGSLREGVLGDIAVLTGARCVSSARGDRLADVGIDALGKARQAWASRAAFGILGGAGDKAEIRQRIADVRGELNAGGHDEFTRDKLHERLGKLAGTAAVIRVGGATRTEQAELKLRVEAAVKSARAGLADGMLPGGGAALLACVPALDALCAGDEALGVKALARALAEPMRVILANAGFEPEPLVAHARCSPGAAFDVVGRTWVDAHVAGIVDPLPVIRLAIESAVSVAMTALTAEVLIHRPDAPSGVEP